MWRETKTVVKTASMRGWQLSEPDGWIGLGTAKKWNWHKQKKAAEKERSRKVEGEIGGVIRYPVQDL
jgi:hypothetical protein